MLRRGLLREGLLPSEPPRDLWRRPAGAAIGGVVGGIAGSEEGKKFGGWVNILFK